MEASWNSNPQLESGIARQIRPQSFLAHSPKDQEQLQNALDDVYEELGNIEFPSEKDGILKTPAKRLRSWVRKKINSEQEIDMNLVQQLQAELKELRLKQSELNQKIKDHQTVSIASSAGSGGNSESPNQPRRSDTSRSASVDLLAGSKNSRVKQ
jgi:hypothetical protein